MSDPSSAGLNSSKSIQNQRELVYKTIIKFITDKTGIREYGFCL